MSFVKYPFPLKGNSLPTTTTKTLFFYSIFSNFFFKQPFLAISAWFKSLGAQGTDATGF